MCGRYTLFASAEMLADRFGVDAPDDHSPRYNCAPGQSLPVVPDDSNKMTRMEWGLVPEWADGQQFGTDQRAWRDSSREAHLPRCL